MKLLLDTHVVFWALIAVQKLSPTARIAIADSGNDVAVSLASLWEMAIKVGSGKWPEVADLVADFEAQMAKAHFAILPITIEHARRAGLMSTPHRDPFDRLLAAQAITEGLTLVTSDAKVAALGAPWLW